MNPKPGAPRIEIDQADLAKLLTMLVEALPVNALLLAGKIVGNPRSQGIFTTFLKSATDLALADDARQLELRTGTATSNGG